MDVTLRDESIKRLSRRVLRHRWQRIVAGLACVVVFCTTYALILPAITLTRQAYCGIEEHTHSDACYEQVLVCGQDESDGHTHTDACYASEQVLVCGLEETEGHVHDDGCYQTETYLTCGLEETEGHVHTDACYERQMTCGKNEHTHTLQCYSNPDADVETEADWAASLPTLTGVWSDDVVAVALSQAGYTESTRNFEVLSDGETTKGYTRYGAWYGDPYGDWTTMFASFCTYYAQVPMPIDANLGRYMQKLADEHLWHAASEADYEPKPGSLVFLDTEDPDDVDRVGVLIKVEDDRLTLLVGDYNNKVDKLELVPNDPMIEGYVQLPEQPSEQVAEVAEPEPEGKPETAPEEPNADDSKAEEPKADDPKPEDPKSEESADETQEPGSDKDKPADETQAPASDADKPEEAGVEKPTEPESGSEDLSGDTNTLTFSGSDYTVTVGYTEKAEIPEDATLAVSEVYAGGVAYNDYLHDAKAALGIEDKRAEARFFDIKIMDGETEVKPAKPVTVTIAYDELPQSADVTKAEAVHFVATGAEVMSVEATVEGDGAQITFDAPSFSVYGVVYTVDFEYELDGKVYQFSLKGGEKIALSELIEALGVLNGTNFESTDAFLADVESVVFSDESLVKVSKNLLGNDWTLQSLKAFDTEEELAVNLKTGERFAVRVTDSQGYTIDVTFKNADGDVIAPDGLSNTYLHVVLQRGGKTYYHSPAITLPLQTGSVNLDGDDFKSWKDQEGRQDLTNYAYQDTDQISVYAFWGYNSYLNPNDINSDGTVIEENGRKAYGNGSIVDGKYLLSVTKKEGGTSVVFQEPKPYSYTVRSDDNAAIEFDNGPWYVFAEVQRDDGRYIYTQKINLSEGAKETSGTIRRLYAFDKPYAGQIQSTIPIDGENISIYLIRGKDHGDSAVTHNIDEKGQDSYFSSSDNINVHGLSGTSIDNRYTLQVTKGESEAVLNLVKGPGVSIAVESYDSGNNKEAAPELIASGAYFIAGEMAFRDGTEDKTCYFVKKLSDGTTAESESFAGKNQEVQYLTGTRSYEPALVYSSNASMKAKQVCDQLIAGNSGQNLTVIRNGDAVESYRLTAQTGTKEAPNTVISLTKLPPVKVAAQIVDTDGNPVPKKDDAQYYVLVEITRGDKKAYAYKPLVFDEHGTMTPTTIDKFQTLGNDPETWYYTEDDSAKYYVVKGSAADLSDAVGSNARFSEGQLTGVYTPSFTFDDTTQTLTTTLKQSETPNGVPYTVSVEMLDKEQKNTKPANPQLTENYYVLAWLTPKGTGSSGPVVGWHVMDADESNLNSTGKFSGTIPANGFNVCNAEYDATGSRIGYDPALFDLNVRMYHSPNAYSTYKDIRKNASDDSPKQYDFMGVYTHEKDSTIPDNTSVIRLHQAYEKDYRIRVYIDNPGLSISEADKYIVRVKLTHETTGTTYAFARLVVNENDGGENPIALQFLDDGNGHIWRDQNGTIHKEYGFTGNEKAVDISVLSLTSTSQGEQYAEWVKDEGQTNVYTLVAPGDSINTYTLSYGEREFEEDVSAQKGHVYDVIRFTEDVKGISKGTIDEYLKTATEFGLYTEILSEHATDMEANIGADRLTGEIGADYGFSGNNIMINRIKVLKRYFDASGNPIDGKQVTLRLYPVESYDEATGNYTLGTYVEKQANTRTIDGVKGVAEFEFDKLPAGRYVLKEVINGQEYTWDPSKTDGVVDAGGTRIQFSEQFIVVENVNVNINYFGTIDPGVDKGSVITHSRQGIIATSDDPTYNALVSANGGQAVSSQGTIYKTGSADWPRTYDIPADMEALRDLSVELGSSDNSKTVRVVNTTLADINKNNGMKFKSDGRYIVVNIDMSDAGSVATANLDTYIDGVRLEADFNAAGNDDASKVLYNFITRDAKGNVEPYTGKINTATQAAGVILAPSAIVANLGGNFGGTIICHEAQHTGSEIHSDSANRVQKINTVLTNGVAKSGDLKLTKTFNDPNIADRTTWFTFEVTARDANGAPIAGSYSASGLKEGSAVTFDENGKAIVLVRAQNSVTITGLPIGAQCTVKEITTPETEHYVLDHYIPTQPNVTIEDGKTSEVTTVNKKQAEFKDIKVAKIWYDARGRVITWPDDQEIVITLYAKHGSSTTTTAYTLKNGQIINPVELPNATLVDKTVGTGENVQHYYELTVTGLPSEDEAGKPYEYWFEETNPGGYQMTYAQLVAQGSATEELQLACKNEKTTIAEDGEFIQNRPEGAATLPSTGGPGTMFFNVLGSALIVASSALLLRRRRALEGGGDLI